MDTEVRRRPGRPPLDRSEPVTREDVVSEGRRRRVTVGPTYNLHVPPGMMEPGGPLDPSEWVRYWANDEQNRIQLMTEDDDWEFVNRTGTCRVDDAGVMCHPIGHHANGSTRYAYLLRKRKQYADEDRAREDERVDAMQRAALSGNAPGAPVEQSYRPKDSF